MKISIFSFAFNDKFPIDIMHRQFKKFLKDDYEFILFNDALEPSMVETINTIAATNGIQCRRVPQEVHKVQNPSESYAETLNWATHYYAVKNSCEAIVLMHSDIFPIQDVSFSGLLGDQM